MMQSSVMHEKPTTAGTSTAERPRASEVPEAPEALRYRELKQLVEQRLTRVVPQRGPETLYEPARYVLSGGGKRIRGVLVILAAEAVGGSAEAAVDAGVAVEVLHNFTLVHDDIMDRASTRRGRATVHTRWDEGTAILVGDVLIGLAHRFLLRGTPTRSVEIIRAFTEGIVDVCEGQALDASFERRIDVTLEDYLHMIAMKTGRLVETAAEIGGLVGMGADEEIAALRSYARHIGQAFQIQDDLLDIVAEEAELGKRIGGDVVEGKKTWLLLTALQRAEDGVDHALLDRLLAGKGLPIEEVDAMRELYRRHGVLDDAAAEVARFVAMAEGDLERLPDTPARGMLVWFARMLMNRVS